MVFLEKLYGFLVLTVERENVFVWCDEEEVGERDRGEDEDFIRRERGSEARSRGT